MALTTKSLLKKPETTFITSFDDGTRLDIRIAELLKKYNLPGVFYIVVDWIDTDGYLTWKEVKQLRADGFAIGSHSMSHPQDLKKLHDDQLHYEIQNSKDMIENVLGENITGFCYPRGRFNKRVKDYVAEAGYMQARVTGKPGVTEIKDSLELPGTIHIYQRDEYGDKSILEFAKETIDRVIKEGGYCNVFGHSKEIERDKNWEVLEQVLGYMQDKT